MIVQRRITLCDPRAVDRYRAWQTVQAEIAREITSDAHAGAGGSATQTGGLPS
jgi:hypothetical protein